MAGVPHDHKLTYHRPIMVELTPDWAFDDRDQIAMAEALVEAGQTARSRDVPVGAVVVDPEGTIVGRGRNRREELNDPTAHAEILALREAARARGDWRLDGCTLYVTLEPCAMCAAACVNARLDCVVWGVPDPKAGFAGSRGNLLEDPRLPHLVRWRAGLRRREAAALLRHFFANLREAG
jgi:tRNA(adenine34) deaminase